MKHIEYEPNQPSATTPEFGHFPSPMDHRTKRKPSQQIVLYSDGVGSDEHPSARYVAGDELYNYELYGSLRKGGAVSFYSHECFGLLAATFTSAFSYLCLKGVTKPMLNVQMNLNKQENLAVQRLTELPMALSFFVGILSDCYPIMGLRRKGYMVVGLVLNAVSVLAIAVLSSHLSRQAPEERSSALVALAIVMIGLASLGCIITYMCVHTRVIELSQRESLKNRGVIQADYLIFRRWTSIGASTFNYVTVGTTDSPHMSLPHIMVLLTFISVMPLPAIIKYWREEHYSLPMPIKVRAQIFWKIVQQKAVWRIMIFLMIFGFFLPIRFNDSANAIRNWSHAAKDNELLIKTIQDLVMIATIYTWKRLLVNSRWRVFFAWAPFFTVVPQLLCSGLAAFDVIRNRYFYRVMVALSNIADGITFLNNVVPLTEIVQEGSEGATVGLTLSLQRLVSIFVSTNSHGLFSGENFFDPKGVKRDLSSARTNVFLSLVLNYGINILSVLGLAFLPSQKLDAQHLRTYGGFTKAASSVIVAFAIILFLYSLSINVMTFVPSFQCVKLVGGKGCK